METVALWTLDELVRRVGAALAGGEYPGSPNGRVRDLPDRRVVRWYATIGLVDRPAATRGRTALYGPRHLLQLVAVKRLQAEGRALADIQAELAGATDATLRRIAALPAELFAPTTAPAARTAPARARFWGDQPARAAPVSAVPSASAVPPMSAVPPVSALAPDSAVPSASALAPESGVPEAGAAGPDPADTVTTLAGLPLGPGALLLLAVQPDADDLDAIHAAARPLLDLLAERGLLNPTALSALGPTIRRSRS